MRIPILFHVKRPDGPPQSHRCPVAPWEAMLRVVCLLLSLYGAGIAQQVHPVTGRHIAQVMGVGGADWLVRSEREAEEAPDAALDAIGIPRGATVADVGAGVG